MILKKFPHEYQMDAKDCDPASHRPYCIPASFGYKNLWISYQRINEKAEEIQKQRHTPCLQDIPTYVKQRIYYPITTKKQSKL